MWSSVAVVFYGHSSFAFIPLIIDVLLLSSNAAKRTYFPDCWYNSIHQILFGKTLPVKNPRGPNGKNDTSFFFAYFTVVYVKIVAWFLLLSEKSLAPPPGTLDKGLAVISLLSFAKTLGPVACSAFDAVLFWCTVVFDLKGGDEGRSESRGMCATPEKYLRPLEFRWWGLNYYPLARTPFATTVLTGAVQVGVLLLVVGNAKEIMWGDACGEADATDYWVLVAGGGAGVVGGGLTAAVLGVLLGVGCRGNGASGGEGELKESLTAAV